VHPARHLYRWRHAHLCAAPWHRGKGSVSMLCAAL
jgi:hypothetical protein